MLAHAATMNGAALNCGTKPGSSLSAFLANCAGTPVSFAAQNIHNRPASMVSTITENQSIALIVPRFMVGRPNAAMMASGGNSLSRSPFCG